MAIGNVLLLVAAVTMVALPGCSGRTAAASNDGGLDGGGSDAFAAGCSAHDTCTGGATCFNGECMSACATPADCATGQYCDTMDYLCHEKTVAACPATPCGSRQLCANGLCSTPPPGFPCGRNSPFDMSDHCGKDAVCLASAIVNGQRVADKQCYSFPLCPVEGDCPVSTSGSICNDGIFPDKSRMCLAGLCKTVANCPAKWLCVYSDDKSILYGQCTDGTAGSVCAKAADCLSSVCKQPYPGAFGSCT